jgi:thiamine-phosphate pyrophosphorylase
MTRLIVISSEKDLPAETQRVNALFGAGLRLFHLRKPAWTIEEQRHFLSAIEPQYLSGISVHQHHALAGEFGLRYCHVKEKDRDSVQKQPGLSYSTSFHSYNDLQFESHAWNYCFLGPLFDSISKTGYQSKFAADFNIEEDLYQRVFALGGINKNNISTVFEKGFYGAAVLGTVWNDPEKSVDNFKALDELCKQHDHTF